MLRLYERARRNLHFDIALTHHSERALRRVFATVRGKLATTGDWTFLATARRWHTLNGSFKRGMQVENPGKAHLVLQVENTFPDHSPLLFLQRWQLYCWRLLCEQCARRHQSSRLLKPVVGAWRVCESYRIRPIGGNVPCDHVGVDHREAFRRK